MTPIHKKEERTVIGNCNSSLSESNLKDFCEVYNLVNLLKVPTCLKKASNPSSIDVILTDRLIKSL